MQARMGTSMSITCPREHGGDHGGEERGEYGGGVWRGWMWARRGARREQRRRVRSARFESRSAGDCSSVLARRRRRRSPTGKRSGFESRSWLAPTKELAALFHSLLLLLRSSRPAMHRAASAGTCKMVSRGRRMEYVRVAPHHRDARGERAHGLETRRACIVVLQRSKGTATIECEFPLRRHVWSKKFKHKKSQKSKVLVLRCDPFSFHNVLRSTVNTSWHSHGARSRTRIWAL
jgi:hypothetical protein